MTLLERLRAETRPAHVRLEQAIDLPNRLGSHETYRQLLARFYGFHAAWEPAAALGLGDPILLADRARAPLLRQDLQALGLAGEEIEALPLCDPLMPIETRPALLGAMYVVEGSTLGGKFVARMVERRLGLDPASGGAYFRSHGNDIGQMWRAFGAYLGRFSAPSVDDEIVLSANRTFDRLHAWFCEGP